MYAPLWTKSNHSFLEGASTPEDLVARAHALGLPALALTDRDGVYGAVKAHVKAKELGIKLVVGAQITFATNLETKREHLVLLFAQNRGGYADLCRLISLGHARCEKGRSLVTMDELRNSSGQLVAVCADPGLLSSLKPIYGDALYGLCTRHLLAADRECERAMRDRARTLGIPLAGGNEVLYHHASKRPLQDVLACIRHRVSLREAGTLIRPNAEHDLKPADVMRARFRDAPELLTATLDIVERCTFNYDELRYRYPGEALPDGKSEVEHLRDLTLAGACNRYPSGVPSSVADQLERELALIRELEYGGYFLTMYEIVQFCKSKSILCQGRGSSANSAVCYCLGITAIDPLEFELLFERFLSRERAEPPDIDLDIEHARREEVIQWVYDRYGRRKAAMVANLIRYRARSAVRDVGKVLGIAETELDGISRLLGHYADNVDEATLRTAKLDTSSQALSQLLSLCRQIHEFPRHLSIHPGGFILGHEPVDTIVPIEPATMENRSVVQWDKYDIEALGLFKVDLLGLGALTAIRHSLNLLGEHKQLVHDMASIPGNDAATYEMISRADTVGVFQIESRAQMAMLPRLKPKEFYDLVVQVAIVRPGPIQGNMVHPYLQRRDDERLVEYPHPSFERVLKKTLGVPIFQEQVMKLAVEAAGYTPGEADQLRRDMGAWKSSGRIETHQDKLISRMIKHGIPRDFAERLFSQILGFGEYGFPESHAASFAHIAYITAWLHCHHPEVFLCAMLNAQPMGFYAPSTLIEDARRHGVITLPIDVNHSRWDCTLEETEAPTALGHDNSFERRFAVRMGYRYVKGLGVRDQEKLAVVPRPVRSGEDFARKSQLPLRSLVVLAEAGAFDSLGLTRREALWRVRGAAPAAHDAFENAAPEKSPPFLSLSVPEQVLWDYRFANHSPRGHPMSPLRPWLKKRAILAASQVRDTKNGKKVDYVGLIICRQRPGTATGVVFLTLEDEQGFVNVVVWNRVFDRYEREVRTASLLGVRGKVQAEKGVVHVVAEELYIPEISLGDHAHKSRDFH
jgi:error-prone DNA polymerase